MFTKLRAIAWKEVYSAFQDRNAILLMFAAPLGLSLIMGLAFGTSGDVSIDTIPVGVVNQDTGASALGQHIDLGQTYQEAFVAPQPAGSDSADAANPDQFQAIHDLTSGRLYHNPQTARQQVEDGDLAALITIPPDFSQQAIAPSGSTSVDVFYDSGRNVSPSIVTSIVTGLTNGLNTVLLAQRVGPAMLTQLGTTLGSEQAAINQAIGQLASGALSAAQTEPIQLEQVNLQGETRSFDVLQYFAPSMAILFMTFAMAAGSTSILQEQSNWTLQRIMTTPTPRWVFMGGKLAGTYVTGIIQMLLLIVLTSLIALMMGHNTSVWGTNYLGIALLVLAVTFTATSLGLLLAALSGTTSQAQSYSSVALFVLGMLGGSFIPIENLPEAISWLPKLTLNYWGIQGFVDLSYYRESLGAIAPNLLALVVMGLVLFAVSLWRFNRRLDI